MWRTGVALAKKFDVCVIGGGPAGIAAALHAVDYGKTSCLIERDRIGGADLWNGALQSKTMWEMAKFAQTTRGRTAKRFVKLTRAFPEITHENIQLAIQTAAETREKQVVDQLRASKVQVFSGVGRFETKNSVEVKLNNGETETVNADYFIIATGAQPRTHPTAIADGKVVFTSDDIMHHPFPKSIVIIGAGVIGCEFATIFANFGKTKVNLIEKSNRILPMEDEDVALFIQKLLEAKNVTLHRHSQLVGNKIVDGKFEYELKDVRNGELHTHTVDSALVSIGRVPNTKSLNLEGIGATMEGGRLVRDHFLRVKPFNHIYACGDVSTRMALVNVGELEAVGSIDHMYSSYPEEQSIMKLDNLSTIMFLDQEVAAVGLNEQQCRKNNIAYKVARYGYEFVSRALAMGNTNGFVKIVVTNDPKMQVLGVRAVGPHASSVVELASLAIHNKESAYNLKDFRTAYPAISQGFQECLQMLLGSSTLKPNVFPELTVEEWNPPHFERGRAYQEK